MKPADPTWEGLDEPQLVDTSEREPVYLLTGRHGSHIRLSRSAHQLLRLMGSGVSAEEIARGLSRAGKVVSAAEIEARHRELLARLEKIEAQASAGPRGFWVRVRLLPEGLVARVSGVLQVAFRPRVAAVLLAIIAVFLGVVAIVRPAIPTQPSAFWAGYALLLVSLIPHEFGHASATAHFGVRPREIGATLYLIYPAFYSDVSGAWRLRRWQRVIVDLGGVYFQLVVAAAYMAAFLLTGWQPLWSAILMILGATVFSINPIFKFDGYWVVADALGVTNLGQQPKRILRRLWKLLRGQPVEPSPWSAGITAILTVYSVLSVAVWGFFLWQLGPRLWSLAASLVPQVADFVAGVPGVSLPSLLSSVFIAAVMLYATWRIVLALVVAPLATAARRLLRQGLRGSGS